MTPEALSAWLPVIRDLVIVIVASILLLYEAIVRTDPNPYVIGAGLTLLGVPPALRIERHRKKTDDDPYEGPGGYYRGG